ncbi:hypothetical protein AWC38_SpisGene6805 [Stylophora pistillata]|uniref:Integrase zinc-binding domain-containing protein n=1 Tax=Stylophora pistillata TaxID=50429 RepID=A0A2B4SF63_STYPI|nr:hypothetical protein AWC38_SpisGene6805 [Stylophora pistillata]
MDSRGLRKKTVEGIAHERILRLRCSRSGSKAVVTRRQRELIELMKNSDNVDQVRAKFLEFELAMRNFYEAHDKYHAELIDGSAIRDSIEYFESVKRVGTAVFQSFDAWLQSAEFKLQEELDLAISLHPEDSRRAKSTKTISPLNPDACGWKGYTHSPYKSSGETTESKLLEQHLDLSHKNVSHTIEVQKLQQQQNQQLQELLKQQQLQTLAMSLPQPEISVFSGHPVKYSDFVRAFENLIESKTSSPSSRLYYLVQYTSGEVKELMQSCLSMDPAEGYKTARALLKDTYGESYKIATALIDQVTKSPQIKADDGPALQRYSVLLTSCKNSLQEIGYLSKIENPDTLQRIIGRLPLGLRQRWREKADHITGDLKREVTIGDIAEFVEAKARIANHPVFGNIYSNEDKNTAASAGSKRRHRTPSKEHKGSAFTTHGTTPESPTDPPKDNTENVPKKSNIKCPLCKESHWLSRCQLFRGKTVDERITFVRSRGLCDNCLVAGHMAMSCPKQSYCQIVGCKIGHRKHSTFLHPKNDKPAKTEPASTSETQSSNTDNEKQNHRARSCFTEVVACEGTCSATGAGASATGLAIVPVNVRAKGKEKMVQTYAFLDPGSNTTEQPIAIMADIEKMFYQVQVPTEDSRYLRFLWWPGGDTDKEPEEFQMLVHLFGGVSSPSCANYALQKTADDNAEHFDKDTIQTVKRNFYVDDCLKSVEDNQQASRLSVPMSERAGSVKELDLENLPVERALGIQWDVQSDTFRFKIVVKDRPPTRRGILSVISSIYDPLGFIALLILPAKAILRDLCRKGLDWDDRIPHEDLVRWQDWLRELPELEQFAVQRCLKPKNFGRIVSSQIHNFSDASSEGYGAVSYLRVINEAKNVHCAFLIGKTRQTPQKSVTIPRLELSAAVVATRLNRMMQHELDVAVDERFFWTHSTCVLSYIMNKERRFQTFVANRITTIHERSRPDQWYYVGTVSNPADDASRGLSAEELINKNRWTSGPSFLWEAEDCWPKQPDVPVEIKGDDPEVKKERKAFSVASTVEVDFLNRMVQSCSSCVEEMHSAEIEVLKYVQRQSFSEELVCLQDKESEVVHKKSVRASRTLSVKKSSSIAKLDPELRNGLLCVGGRLRHAPIEQERRHPIILPKNHHVVDLIVRHYHLLSGHSGQEYVLSLIRKSYWIIKGRVAVRRVVNRCLSCRRRQAPSGAQKMADLPTDRVTPDKPPFSFVGVDCFGPFWGKEGQKSSQALWCLVYVFGYQSHSLGSRPEYGHGFVFKLIESSSRRVQERGWLLPKKVVPGTIFGRSVLAEMD